MKNETLDAYACLTPFLNFATPPLPPLHFLNLGPVFNLNFYKLAPIKFNQCNGILSRPG